MRFIIFDIEVFAYDNVSVFKEVGSTTRTVFHNDNEGFREFMSQDDAVFVGANNKHYDNHISKAIASDWSPQEVKLLNDFIIVGGNEGWNYPPLKQEYFYFNSCDLFDDMQQGLSVKAIEAHLGMNIEETEVDFNLDRPLTPEELERTIRYCSYDVDAEEVIFTLRKDYFNNKMYLGKIAGITPEKALYMTNAKLTAAFLKAKPADRDDERCYTYPENLRKEFIPQEVFDFFDKMHDLTIPEKELWSGKLNINVGDCEVTLAYGGIHGCNGSVIIEADGDTILINEDVGSYYPHLMTINGYCSRSIPDPKIYEEMLESRMRAKKSGDTATANALKLVANTTYGAMLSPFNDLYDALMGRSVCVSGQLYLLELAEHCITVPTCKIVQLNTDGIMLTVSKKYEAEITAIADEWQQRTGFELERDDIAKIVQKDVNNYIEIQKNGKVKCKGVCVVKGVSKAGAFNINNNFTIVSKAVVDYFTKGTPVEETINSCNDPLSFQIVAKAGSKYSGAFHFVDGEKVPVQRVNRVYATKNRNYGTLVRVHAEKGNDNKISGLPAHCIVDNKNTIDISEIDKSWYISLAENYIKDFLGKSRKIRRTNTRKINSLKKQILKILEE